MSPLMAALACRRWLRRSSKSYEGGRVERLKGERTMWGNAGFPLFTHTGALTGKTKQCTKIELEETQRHEHDPKKNTALV